MPERVTKRQERAAATAEQLLTAAREVFEARGYQATTVGAITSTANTAHGTFYLYFKNKEDAFGRVVASAIEQIWEETSTTWEGDIHADLLEVNRRFIETFSRHRGLWRCLHEGMHQSKAVEEMWADVRRPFVERIAGDLERMTAEGRARPMNAELAAYALAALAEWFAFTYVVMEEPSPREYTPEQVASTMTDLWFHAVFRDDAGVPRPGAAAADE